MPAAQAGLQHGTLAMQPADNQFTRPGQSLPAVAGGDRGRRVSVCSKSAAEPMGLARQKVKP